MTVPAAGLDSHRILIMRGSLIGSADPVHGVAELSAKAVGAGPIHRLVRNGHHSNADKYKHEPPKAECQHSAPGRRLSRFDRRPKFCGRHMNLLAVKVEPSAPLLIDQNGSLSKARRANFPARVVPGRGSRLRVLYARKERRYIRWIGGFRR